MTLRYFRLVSCAKKTAVRMRGIQVSHHIPSRMGEIRVHTGHPHSLRGPRRQTNALDDRKPAQRVVDHEGRVETGLPEWLQPFTERLTGESSSSTDVSPADVAIPPPAIPPSAHPPAKLTSNRAGGKAQCIHSYPKDPNCEVCRRTKVTRAPCRRNPYGRTFKSPKGIGDMLTADHKAPNEEQESRMHHKYAVVVQDLATHWIQSYPCRDQISSRDAEKSENMFLHPEENSTVNSYGQFFGNLFQLARS